MSGIRTFVVAGVVAWFGLSAEVSQAALAKKAGGSGFSGTLSRNTAIRKQQLICDPDDPVAGSTSVRYNPGVVSVSSFEFGPGYTGTAFVEVMTEGERTTLVPLSAFLDGKAGTETGYVQVRYGDVNLGQPNDIVPTAVHGQIAPPTGYTVIDEDGPSAVDTHALFFDYLDTVSDDTVAEYTIFAARANQFSNGPADFLTGVDDQGVPFTLTPDQIASATVRGNLNAVPVPAAALTGGLMLAGMAGVRKFRRRAV